MLHRDMVEQEEKMARLVDMVGKLQGSINNLTIVGQEESWAEFVRGWLEVTLVVVSFCMPLIVTSFLWVMSRFKWGWKMLPVLVVPCLAVSLKGTCAGLALILGDTVREKVSALLGSWPARMLGLGASEEQSAEPPAQWSLLAPWTWPWLSGSWSGSRRSAADLPESRQQDSPV